MKHFFMSNNNYDDFSDFIENIMFNKNNHYLVFDDNNILMRINCLYGINDDIATITVEKQYEFKNNIPEPYYNYIFTYDNDYILLDDKEYDFLNALGETIDNIYSFQADKDNFNEIVEHIKLSYLTNHKQYCWKIFENYAQDYFKIINVNKPKIYNKYDEDYHYEEIYDKIYNLQKKYKSDIINQVVNKYKIKN